MQEQKIWFCDDPLSSSTPFFWPSSAPRIGPQGVQTSHPWTANCGQHVLKKMACQKGHNNLESLKRYLLKAVAVIPWWRCVRWYQSGWSVSRLVSRKRAAILSDIIINKTLKLLLINYLPPKVDVLFNFPSRSHCTCNSTHGKTRYSTTATECSSFKYASFLVIHIETQKQYTVCIPCLYLVRSSCVRCSTLTHTSGKLFAAGADVCSDVPAAGLLAGADNLLDVPAAGLLAGGRCWAWCPSSRSSGWGRWSPGCPSSWTSGWGQMLGLMSQQQVFWLGQMISWMSQQLDFRLGQMLGLMSQQQVLLLQQQVLLLVSVVPAEK